jgi:hypothetical protein
LFYFIFLNNSRTSKFFQLYPAAVITSEVLQILIYAQQCQHLWLLAVRVLLRATSAGTQDLRFLGNI